MAASTAARQTRAYPQTELNHLASGLILTDGQTHPPTAGDARIADRLSTDINAYPKMQVIK
jgi:hypothetical protein